MQIAAHRTRRQVPATGRREASAASCDRLGALLGSSVAMQRMFHEIECVATTEATVLVVGESGTGKELVARCIHDNSARADGPFVAVNCGAIPAGLLEAELFGHEQGSFTGAHARHVGHFERAAGGTLFLDEIGDTPLDMQVRLLRVLESRFFQRVGGSAAIASDARVIAATHRDLVALARDGGFREDLLYRLAVFPIQVPALRERGDDIVALAEHFLAELNRASRTDRRFSKRSRELLRQHPCPGNVRGLRNAVHRAYILATDQVDIAGCLQAGDLRPARHADRVDLKVGTGLDAAQRELILATLAHYQGDKPRAADVLGISLKTLYNRLESYGSRG